jgi:hypothetical protein
MNTRESIFGIEEIMRYGCGRKSGDRCVLRQTVDGWHWRLLAPNGHLIGASIKAYASKRSCIQNAIRLGIGLRDGLKSKQFVKEVDVATYSAQHVRIVLKIAGGNFRTRR